MLNAIKSIRLKVPAVTISRSRYIFGFCIKERSNCYTFKSVLMYALFALVSPLNGAVLEQVKEDLRISFRNMKTLSYEFESKTEFGPETIAGGISEQFNKVTLFLDKDKFATQSSYSNLYSSCAYDGNTFQYLDRKGGTLNLSKKREHAYGATLPHIVAFDWFRDAAGVKNQLSYQVLNDYTAWEKCFNKASIIKGRSSGNSLYVKYEQEVNPNGTAYIVKHDIKLNHSPVEWQLIKNDGSITWSMSAEDHVKIPGSEFYIAGKVMIKSESNMKVSLTVDSRSIKYNRPINKSVFTIPREYASEIFDAELEEAKIKKAADRADQFNSTGSTTTNKSNFNYIIANALIVVILLILLYLKMVKK